MSYITIETESIPLDVVNAFNDTALELIQKGYKRFGAFGILNKIRWEMALKYQGRKFKCSNNWAPLLSRNFAKTYPQHNEFFKFKKRKLAAD